MSQTIFISTKDSLIFQSLTDALLHLNLLEDMEHVIDKNKKDADISITLGDRVENFTAPFKIGAVLECLITLKNHPMETNKDIYFSGYTLKQSTLDLTHENAKKANIRLTEKERDIIIFLKNSLRPMTKDDLLKYVWKYADDTDTHTIETHIYRLRQKIEKTPSEPQIIVTQDDGYVLKS